MQKIEKIKQILDEKKAENIEIVDMSDKEYVAKFVIIATTLNSRHAASLKDELEKLLGSLGEKILRFEQSDEWSVIDLGDVLIHLMSQNYRMKYDIETFLNELKIEKN